MYPLSSRQFFLLGFLGSTGLIAMALYLEHIVGLVPCPLCHVQRFAVALFGVVCLLAAVHNPTQVGSRVYAIFTLLSASFGIAAAGRQIWLQGLPKDQLPSCLPPMEFMLEAFPLQEVISKVLHGTADCAEINWTLLGLNLAQLSMISFILMFTLSVYIFLQKKQQPAN
ncbi:disulfide bond formation protein B [Denitrificimonas sp. JX-1]|uniref:Disulfide bond formation protein B n=1 Tax=Denitrificimonas halotolerans TaxID=3098930 RepID=A0ABU5GN95_9GAMM|nr:disulfide bond formation protein B [Denitrificimonas sp. JX-1]MDY7218324.1 disulfide bond formation protein B [Denitrificimonas sp. JX-1]